MRLSPYYKIEIIPLLLFLDILILIITASIRNQYILFHLAEIILLLILIVVFIISQKNKDDREDKFQLIFFNMILVFSIIWMLGVVILNRVQTELNQDFPYALLLITFLFTILIFILISMKEIISQKLITKSSLHIALLTWIIFSSSFLITTFLLAPAEDISELIININRLF